MVVKKILILLVTIFFSLSAHSNSTYNFYFVKDKAEKKTEPVEKNTSEVPSVALPEKKEEPKPIVSKETKVQTTLPPVEEKRNFKRWQLSLGVGFMAGSYTSIEVPYSLDDMMYGGGPTVVSYSQNIYAIEGRLNFNRYFNLGGELLIPNGDTEYRGFYNGPFAPSGKSTKMSPQLTILMGATPFHFTIFGAQFMELGADLGILATDSGYTNSGNIKPIIGPRLAFNFGEKVALVFSAKGVTSGDDSQWFSTMNLAYRW